MTLSAKTSRKKPKLLPSSMVIALAGHAFINGSGSGPTPWAVKVKGFAFFAFFAGCIMFAGACHLPRAIHGALRGVPVAFAAASNGEVGDAHPLQFDLFFIFLR